MKRILPSLILCLLAAPAFADAVDEAEAKKRGVTVEVVQLESAKEKIASLESEIAKLKKQVATVLRRADDAYTEAEQAKKTVIAKDAEISKMRASLTPAQKEKIDAVDEAIKSHRVMRGMTIEQAKKSVPGQPNSWSLTSESNGTQTYICVIGFFQNDDTHQTRITLVTAYVRDGLVVDYETKPTAIETWFKGEFKDSNNPAPRPDLKISR